MTATKSAPGSTVARAAAKGGERKSAAPATAAAVQAGATAAVSEFTTVLGAAKSRVAALILDKYGRERDDKRDPLAAVRLGQALARDLSGAAKGRGGERAKVIQARALWTEAGAPAEARAFVLAARAVLDREAAAKSNYRARKQALADKVNDTTRPIAERQAALGVLAEMDANDANASRAAAAAALAKSAKSANAKGVTFSDALATVAFAFGMDATETGGVWEFTPATPAKSAK